MRDIRVFGELELLDLVERGVQLPDHLISIGNPRPPWRRAMPGEFLQPAFKDRFKRILRLQFFDAERKDHLGELRPRRIPTRRDVRRVIRFWDGSKDEASGYVVHCWGGLSRSAGVALGLLYLDSGSEVEAARRLRAIRPEAGPHRLILRLFDAELGSRLFEAGSAFAAARLAELKQRLEDESCEELPGAD